CQDAVILADRGGATVGAGQGDAREQAGVVAGDPDAAEGIDPGTGALRVSRPQGRLECGGGEIAVGGQVEEAMLRRLAAPGLLGGLVAAELQRLGAAEALAEVAADGGDLVAGGRQAPEVGEEAGPGLDGRRSAGAAVGAGPRVAAVVDVAGQ